MIQEENTKFGRGTFYYKFSGSTVLREGPLTVETYVDYDITMRSFNIASLVLLQRIVAALNIVVKLVAREWRTTSCPYGARLCYLGCFVP